ncbi:TonB-dependent receptor [Prolixibacteraceae bacterium JC049]|nr:TonB-dependent receptor [Prolixibacteraceae bacterium JC049]
MRILVLLIIVVLTSFSSIAQPKHKIKLLDADKSTPIQGATFLHGNQKGISDKDGFIVFNMSLEDDLQLSHISYGVLNWMSKELRELIKQKVVYLKTNDVNLYPVTVIAVHGNGEPDTRIEIDYQDKMKHDGASILNQIPSISSIRKGGNYGFDPVFRGYKYDQLNIVFNGAQSATAACPNRMDPPTSQMAPNMLERIEVLKGPYALRYGTGFGATINFIPSRLKFSEKNKVNGRFSSGYETNGELFQTEGKIGLKSKKWNFNLFGAWSQGEDYTTGEDNKVASDFQRGSFGTSIGTRLSEHQEIQLISVYNVARDADFPALPMDLRDDDTWMFNLKHSAEFRTGYLKEWNTNLFGSFVDHLMDNRLKSLNPRMLNAETKAETYNYGGRTEGKWIFLNSKLYAGMDLRMEGAKGIRTRAFLMGPKKGKILKDNAWQDGQISKTGLFAEYQLHTSLFDYVFSGRIEINHAQIDDVSDEFAKVYEKVSSNQVNPAFSVGIQKQLPANKTIGLWLGRVQRSGSLTERFINYFPVGQDPYELIGNPKIKPEVNNQLDLTFQWSRAHSVLDVDYFVSYLQDYISSVIDPSLTPRMPTSPGVRRFMNIEEAFKTGFEISWSQQLLWGLQHQIGFAYTYAKNLDNNDPLPEIPPLDAHYTISGKWMKDRLKPELSFHYAAKQKRVAKEFGETETPSFSVMNIKVEYQITKNIRVNAGINNLFDKAYYEHLNRSVKGSKTPIYAPGRSFYSSLNIVW